MRRRLVCSGILVIASVLVCLAVRTDAQDVAAAPATQRSRPTVVFEHDATDTMGFTLYVRPSTGEELRVDLGALRPDSKGRITVPLPPLPRGIYAFEVAAYNASGESRRAAASPARLEITADLTPLPETPYQAAEGAHPHHADQTPASPKSAAERPEPEKEPAKNGGGVLGRIWKGAVGN